MLIERLGSRLTTIKSFRPHKTLLGSSIATKQQFVGSDQHPCHSHANAPSRRVNYEITNSGMPSRSEQLQEFDDPGE